jgi:putative heme transporter
LPVVPKRAPRSDIPAWLDRQAAIVGRLLVLVLAAAAVIWFALRVQFITIAVVIGFAEVSLLWPLVRALRNRKVPQVLAAILCVAAFLSFFALLLVFVVAEIVRASPRMADQVVEAVENVLEWVRSGPFGVDDEVVRQVIDELQQYISTFVGAVGEYIATGLGVIANLVTVVLIATFFAIFALASGDKLWRQFTNALPEEHRRPATGAFRSAMRTTGAWFYASTITGLVDGFFIGLGLLILGVPLAVPIGALTFVLAYIPLLGATIAGVVAVAVALATQGPTAAIIALMIVLAVQQIEGNVLAPLLMARAVSFHPLIILVMTTTAATMFGIAGLFLAVPLAGAIVAAVMGWRRNAAEATAGEKRPRELTTGTEAEPDRTLVPGASSPGS